MAENRIGYIDIAKGIGILLVVIGHSMLNGSYPFRVIYAFHMPLFFFLAGFCYDSTKYSFGLLLKRRGRQLLVPLFVFSAILLIVRIPVLNFPIEFSWRGFPFSMWFVFVLFCVEIVSYFIVKLPVVLIFSIGILSSVLYYFDVTLPYSLSCLPAGVMFYCIGNRFRQDIQGYSPCKLLIHKLVGGGKIVVLCISFAIVMIYAYCCPICINMNSNVLPLASIIIAFCGIVLVISVSSLLTGTNAIIRSLIFLGRNTFVIMAFHQFYMYIANVHIKPLLCHSFIEMALYKVLQQAIMWTGVLVTIWVVNNKAKWMIGR